MNNLWKMLTFAFLLVALAVIIITRPTVTKNSDSPAQDQIHEEQIEQEKNWYKPMDNALSRVTKKHYSTYVEPGNSPVEPEVFRGFHTGTDFEIFPGEENIDVNVYAICAGEIVRFEPARGYGGMLVQSCNIERQHYHVVYGHIKLSSVEQQIGDALSAGQKFAVLGAAFSDETGNERKHLHLGVHKDGIDTRGYVSSESLLSGWADFEEFSLIE